jgi:hypothetical protein
MAQMSVALLHVESMLHAVENHTSRDLDCSIDHVIEIDLTSNEVQQRIALRFCESGDRRERNPFDC